LKLISGCLQVFGSRESEEKEVKQKLDLLWALYHPLLGQSTYQSRLQEHFALLINQISVHLIDFIQGRFSLRHFYCQINFN